MSTSELDPVSGLDLQDPAPSGPVAGRETDRMAAPRTPRPGAGTGQPTPASGGSAAGLVRFARSELRLIFRRRRNIALLFVLSLAPILLGIAVRVSAPSNGEGPPFIGEVTENGLFLAFTSLVVTLPVFLP